MALSSLVVLGLFATDGLGRVFLPRQAGNITYVYQNTSTLLPSTSLSLPSTSRSYSSSVASSIASSLSIFISSPASSSAASSPGPGISSTAIVVPITVSSSIANSSSSSSILPLPSSSSSSLVLTDGAANASISGTPQIATTFHESSSPTISSIVPSSPSSITTAAPITSSVNSTANDTCGGITVNILNANLEWWYTSVFEYAVATIIEDFNDNGSVTAWSVQPATTTFDVTSALALPTTSLLTTFDALINSTIVYEVEYITAAPVFASTGVVTQTAYNPLNATTGTGPVPTNLIVTPAPASTVLPGPVDNPWTALTGSAFLYLTQYVIDTPYSTVYQNGTAACATSRETFNLSAPYALFYDGADPNGELEITGPLIDGFLGLIPQSTATPGYWLAQPTLIAVVEDVYSAQGVLAASTVSSLLTPTTTQGVTAVTETSLDTPGGFIVATTTTSGVYVESSETALDVPSTTSATTSAATAATLATVSVGSDASATVVEFVADVGTSTTTILATVASGTEDTLTTTIGDSVVVATAVGDIQTTQATSTESTANALSAFESVLSEALAGEYTRSTTTTSQPTTVAAVAIASNAVSVLTIGTSTITQSPVQVFVVASTTLTAGSAITISSTVISAVAAGGAIVVGTSTVPVAAAASSAMLTVDGQTITATNVEAFVVAGQTLQAGGSAVTVDGSVVSLAPSATALIVNGVTETLSSAAITAAPLVVVGGTTYQADAGSMYEIDGQQLTAGGAIVVAGTTISLAAGGSVLVENGVTQTLAAAAGAATSANTAPVLTLNGQTYTASSGVYVVQGQTLTAGGIITLSGGTTVSLAAAMSDIVINGVTSTIAQNAATVLPTLTIAGQTYIANSNSAYVVDGQTLTAGGAITVSGTTISLATSASDLVVNGVTSTIVHAAALPTLTIAGQTYTANSNSVYVIDGQTLTAGGAITVSGTTLSLASSASDLVLNGVTSTIKAASTITSAPTLTIDGQLFTAASGTGLIYSISGQVLTAGGAITFSGPNGLETVSLSPGGTALVVDVSGAITTSAVPTGSATVNTAAPIISIGGETFIALPGAGTSYLIDGQTLYPGGAALTETISGHVYIVSLSPSASVLMIEEEGPGGSVTATMYETLYPATATAGTMTMTSTVAAAGSGSSVMGSAATASSTSTTGLQNVGSADKKIGATLVVGAAGVALLAALL